MLVICWIRNDDPYFDEDTVLESLITVSDSGNFLKLEVRNLAYLIGH